MAGELRGIGDERLRLVGAAEQRREPPERRLHLGDVVLGLELGVGVERRRKRGPGVRVAALARVDLGEAAVGHADADRLVDLLEHRQRRLERGERFGEAPLRRVDLAEVLLVDRDLLLGVGLRELALACSR